MQILSTRAQYKIMCPSPLFLELRPLCRRSTILLKTLMWILKAGRRKYLDLTDIWFHFGPRAKVFWNFRRVQILVDTLKEKKIELLCERSKEKKCLRILFATRVIRKIKLLIFDLTIFLEEGTTKSKSLTFYFSRLISSTGRGSAKYLTQSFLR